MELAIINGTYRDSKESRNAQQQAAACQAAQLVSPQVPLSALRAATPLGFYGFLKQSKSSSQSHLMDIGSLDPSGHSTTHYLNFDGITGAPLILSQHHHAAARLSANGLSHHGGGHHHHPQSLLPPGATADSLLYATSPYTTTDYATYLQLAEYPPEHGGLFAR
jgi:hypothetical protein